MIFGHFGAAFLVKALLKDRQTPLAFLFIASQFQDFIWMLLVPLKVEVIRATKTPNNATFPIDIVYTPYSHSLFTTILLTFTFALVSPAAALASASHWILDFIVHVATLDLCFPFFDCARVGLGLWRWRGPSIAVEAAIVVLGVVLYARSTKAPKQSMRILAPFALTMVLLTVASPFTPQVDRFDWTTFGPLFAFYAIFVAVAGRTEKAVITAENASEHKAQ